MLVFEVPARDQSPPDMAAIVSQRGVAITYIVTTAFFAVDFLLQTTSKCVWFHETAYLRDRYNFIDLVVLVFEIIDLAGWQRFGKALQPVRILKRSPGMRTVMETLLSTWRPVSTTIVVMFVFVTILSVTGMRLFGNRYHHRGIHKCNILRDAPLRIQQNVTWAPKIPFQLLEPTHRNPENLNLKP